MEPLEPQELLTELEQLEPLELHMEHQVVLPALNQVPHMDNLVHHMDNLAHHTDKEAQAHLIKELQELQELVLALQVLDHQEVQVTPSKQKDIEFEK
jgi:transcription elongation GreA/GreB family factor